jgi:hypothetical protein
MLTHLFPWQIAAAALDEPELRAAGQEIRTYRAFASVA